MFKSDAAGSMVTAGVDIDTDRAVEKALKTFSTEEAKKDFLGNVWYCNLCGMTRKSLTDESMTPSETYWDRLLGMLLFWTLLDHNSEDVVLHAAENEENIFLVKTRVFCLVIGNKDVNTCVSRTYSDCKWKMIKHVNWDYGHHGSIAAEKTESYKNVLEITEMNLRPDWGGGRAVIK